MCFLLHSSGLGGWRVSQQAAPRWQAETPALIVLGTTGRRTDSLLLSSPHPGPPVRDRDRPSGALVPKVRDKQIHTKELSGLSRGAALANPDGKRSAGRWFFPKSSRN